MAERLATDSISLHGFELCCPACQRRLEHPHGHIPIGDRALFCPACDREYACLRGIWRMLLPDPSAYREDFLYRYRTVRLAEGWGSLHPGYYRELPCVPDSDPQAGIWKARARNYGAFVSHVLLPLEAQRNRALKVLDLGAGNGWLANRLAKRGHQVAAIDLSDDDRDGLGACRYYDKPVLAVQAGFDRLPFARGQADLIVFNAALHYSTDLGRTLAESLAILAPGGKIVVLDSPVYHDSTSGSQMVRAREERFRQVYGLPMRIAEEEQGFLTWDAIQELSRRLAIRWEAIWSEPAWRHHAHRVRAALRQQREPAGFPILIGQPGLAWKPARRILAAVRRFSLRARYRLVEQPRATQSRFEWVEGSPMLILPGVFNPVFFGSGAFLARTLRQGLILPDSEVLDLGTGSGVAAIVAAGIARRVVAVDINPVAVRCAQMNAQYHQASERLEVRQGDLFAPVQGERFDVILCNPPFYYGSPASDWEQAFFSMDFDERFAAGLSASLKPSGCALLVLAVPGNAPSFLRALWAHGFQVEAVAEEDLASEILTIYRVTADPGASMHDHPV